MKLHENKALFEEAVLLTSKHKGLREIYIEKDYWVTLALHTIFTTEIGKEAVFKGGTSLSKCFQIIERFSEDIDLVVLRNEGDSNSKMKDKIAKIGHCVKAILPEVEIEGVTKKLGMNRTTAHRYEKIFEGDFGQIRDSVIILEPTWLGSFEPYTTASVQSYIAEMMYNQNQTDLIKTYNLQPFQVNVLTKERTFCEKIMGLVKFSFSENAIADLNDKVRHIYDIHKLLQNQEVNAFFNTPTFEELLLKVANDDLKSYKNAHAWLANPPSTAILFSDSANTWTQLLKTYNTDFRSIVFGELPSEKDILNTLNKVSTRLKSIKWTIELSEMS